jgi:hypothetical protein
VLRTSGFEGRWGGVLLELVLTSGFLASILGVDLSLVFLRRILCIEFQPIE